MMERWEGKEIGVTVEGGAYIYISLMLIIIQSISKQMHVPHTFLRVRRVGMISSTGRRRANFGPGGLGPRACPERFPVNKVVISSGARFCYVPGPSSPTLPQRSFLAQSRPPTSSQTTRQGNFREHASSTGTNHKTIRPAFRFWLCLEYPTPSTGWPYLSEPDGLTCTCSQKVEQWI